MIKLHNAVRAVHLNAVSISGNDIDSIKAWDNNGIQIELNINAINAWVDPEAYKYQRAAEYPDFKEYLDGIVKGDQAQIDKYIADCLAVKAKYPKG